MRNGKRWSTVSTGIYLILMLLHGCVARQADLVEAGSIEVDILPSVDKNVRISKVDVYYHEDVLVVAGTAVTDGPLFSSYKGHIDAVLLGPDNTEISLRSAEYRHFPSRNRVASFELRFSPVAVTGAKVLLIYHNLDNGGVKHELAVDLLKKGPLADSM